jgi:signal transduction histidine kinase
MGCHAHAGLPATKAIETLQENLAQLLHDGPLQDLVAIKHMAASLAKLGELGHVDRAARLADLQAHADASIDRMRELIRTFADPPSSAATLAVRFDELVKDFREGTGIEIRTHVKPQHLRFAPELEEVLFRAVRELLTNVRQHARATTIALSTARRLDGSIVVTVADDGVGLSKPRRPSTFVEGGFGLWAIEQRLGSFGGYLELESGRGLTATLVIPAAHAQEER